VPSVTLLGLCPGITGVPSNQVQRSPNQIARRAMP
jgi:hypothetical protein